MCYNKLKKHRQPLLVISYQDWAGLVLGHWGKEVNMYLQKKIVIVEIGMLYLILEITLVTDYKPLN